MMLYANEPQARVHALLTPGTRVLIGHSLGSVVAFEAAQTLDYPLPLSLRSGAHWAYIPSCTNGSSAAPRFPSAVRHWVNIADRNDIVAAEPDLAPLSGRPHRPGQCWRVATR